MHVERFRCLPSWRACLSVVPQGWEDFNRRSDWHLDLVASRSILSSDCGQVMYSKVWTGNQGQGFSSGVWIPRMHLAKVRIKVKRKWRNFFSGQNAFISPRATNLGRKSWFACPYVINCICKWQSPSHSGLKGRPWLSVVFDILLFSDHFCYSLFTHSLQSLSEVLRVALNTLHWGDNETWKSEVTCQSHVTPCSSCWWEVCYFIQGNVREILGLLIWLIHDGASRVELIFWLSEWP